MVMKIASCISGQVNTPIILKSLIEPALFWAELYKQHYSLETTMSYGIFWTLEVRGCAPNSLMIKVQIFCCSKVYIIQAVLRFGCDFLLDYGHIFHAPRSEPLNSIFKTSAKTFHRLILVDMYNQTAGLHEYKACSLFCNFWPSFHKESFAWPLHRYLLFTNDFVSASCHCIVLLIFSNVVVCDWSLDIPVEWFQFHAVCFLFVTVSQWIDNM